MRTQQPLLGMLELEVLVWELLPVNALAARPITIREVSTLNHELFDHTVECRTLVSIALLAGCKGTEVLSCLCPISAEFHRSTIPIDIPLA